jgi:hypothetical protein
VSGASSWQNWFRRDTGGAIVLGSSGADSPTSLAATAMYAWGLQRFQLGTGVTPWNVGRLDQMQGGGLADALYAMPMPLPDGTIKRLAWACTGNPPAAGNIRLGLYGVKGGTGTDNLYPGSLLHDSGALLFATLGLKGGTEISISVTAGLYYAVLTCDTGADDGASQGVSTFDNAIYPVLGATVRFGNGEPVYNSSLCVGFRHAQTFGALPSTFPSSAPRRLLSLNGTDDIPCIFFGFDPG